jgi:hypothetical protein
MRQAIQISIKTKWETDIKDLLDRQFGLEVKANTITGLPEDFEEFIEDQTFSDLNGHYSVLPFYRDVAEKFKSGDYRFV